MDIASDIKLTIANKPMPTPVAYFGISAAIPQFVKCTILLRILAEIYPARYERQYGTSSNC